MNGGSATGALDGERLRASRFNVRQLGAFARPFDSDVAGVPGRAISMAYIATF